MDQIPYVYDEKFQAVMKLVIDKNLNNIFEEITKLSDEQNQLVDLEFIYNETIKTFTKMYLSTINEIALEAALNDFKTSLQG